MSLRSALAAAALLFPILSAAPAALAFDHSRDQSRSRAGCDADCYQKVRQPDVYGTIQRPAVVEPARSETVHQPAAIAIRPQRIEVIPGQWHGTRTPAIYGSMQKHVLAKPAKVTYSHVPAVYKTVHEEVQVRPAAIKWSRSHDRFGHETMCKVPVAGETRTVARKVLVQPAQRIAHTTPAVFRSVTTPVLMAPAKVRHTYQPPVHQWVANAHVIRPAMLHTVTHPAVIGSVDHTVLVKKGGYRWQRSH
jgi:hypothetical protein